eukprot:TRINITY_DN75656_c0_g1_i1.p1 TRINITY_DN75656_c0_g1~~TRINITY_DN75656_c0_g1_i1.p1  ORF type:complete len:162 (-),score=13.32 TRINITY_DN75656_c0_g1_i1:318-803(-)
MGLPGQRDLPHGASHYWGDFSSPLGIGIDSETFGLIICTFVFEHISQPFIAMRSLARILQYGGYVIWAAPMFQQYHGSPHDYFRYTPSGAQALAQDAGLEVVQLYSPGDLRLVQGVMMGMLTPYWSEQQMLSEWIAKDDDKFPRYPLSVFMLLRKPFAPRP